MEDVDVSDNSQSAEAQSILPPPNVYNKAVLEAFQGAATKNERLVSHPDLVVILAGSFSKGLATYYSDSDFLFVTDQERLKGDVNIMDGMYPEFNRLADHDPRYAELKKYGALGEIIYKRSEKKRSNDRLTMWKESEKQGALLQRAYKRITPEIPERGSYAGYFWEQENVYATKKGLSNAILNFDSDQEYSPESCHDTIAILSAEVGVNAHEVTSGTLQQYKNSIVRDMKELQATDPTRYSKFLEVMRMNYLNYTRSEHFDFDRQIHPKSPLLKSTLMRTEEGQPVLAFYQRFSEFPGVEELEEFYAKQNTDKQEILNTQTS